MTITNIITHVGTLVLAGLLVASIACDSTAKAPEKEAADAAAPASTSSKVGYDLRTLKPRDERLKDAFDRMRAEAQAEQKRVAVLFSADWCHRCQKLEAELGNMHPKEKIGDVRILVLKEEDWEDATRMDEFNKLRLRWEPVIGTYPLFVLLDDAGRLQEEMKDAIGRLESEGLEPTVDNWFDSSRASSL